VELRAADGTPGPAANLAAWHGRLTRALALPSSFAGFLALDLGLPPLAIQQRKSAYTWTRLAR
jgi:hypothetical protein